jgi:L-asparaginase II
MSETPVLVELWRGGLVESRHRGSAAVCDEAGRVVMAWGDAALPVYARSALKPLQALPLVASGAADAFGLRDAELALACGSHHGEPAHVERVASWLARIGCHESDLECGAHRPIDQAAAEALVRASEAPSALHNNCSGEHAGFLTTARHLGELTRGYIAAEHPAQRRVIAAVEAMSSLDLSHTPRGTDGCGIPVVAIALSGLARAMARMADPRDVPPGLAAASRRLMAAMAAEPLMVSGSTGFATALLRAAGAEVCAKPGAEGVYAAALPRLKLGLALKIEDGAGRASEVALGAILTRLGALEADAPAALAERFRPPVRNVAGAMVGEIRPAAAFASS